MLKNSTSRKPPKPSTILNEVLSLNAQEWLFPCDTVRSARFLNEVLSLNAQEFVDGHDLSHGPVESSMKS